MALVHPPTITSSPLIVLMFLPQFYDFVEEERQKQDKGQVLSQICEEEGIQEQSPGPGQGHPERFLEEEGDSEFYCHTS